MCVGVDCDIPQREIEMVTKYVSRDSAQQSLA